MIASPLKDVAAACGGTLFDVDQEAAVEAVVIDSRRAGPGALFAALAGERADGHDFVTDALARGAVAALVSRQEVRGARVVVADVVAALGRIAASARGRLRTTVVGITGSSGKTGTKDLIAAAVGTARRVTASPASYNNEIGVPLTVLSADRGTEVLVVELGSRGRGHIAGLMDAVQPDIGVVTNIGPAHLGLFGSLETTASSKAELIEALPAEGVAVLNADDPLVAAMAGRSRARVLTFGLSEDADVRAADVALDEHGRARFTALVGGAAIPVRLAMAGEHMVGNALAALAVADALGVAAADAAAGIAACTGSAGRMQVSEADRLVIIDDSYNANPDSMAAALRALVAMARGRPTWAVLGHMAELGAEEPEAHRRIGRLVVDLGVDHLIAVGPEARPMHEEARSQGMSGEDALAMGDADAAVALLRERLPREAVVLVKASRAAGLERIVRALGGSA